MPSYRLLPRLPAFVDVRPWRATNPRTQPAVSYRLSPTVAAPWLTYPSLLTPPEAGRLPRRNHCLRPQQFGSSGGRASSSDPPIPSNCSTAVSLRPAACGFSVKRRGFRTAYENGRRTSNSAMHCVPRMGPLRRLSNRHGVAGAPCQWDGRGSAMDLRRVCRRRSVRLQPF